MRRTTWLWARFLVVIDGVLGTHLVERELVRRRHKIEQLVTQLKTVNQDLTALAQNLRDCRLALCLIALKARSESEDVKDWLHFAPHSNGQEALLDSAIECLVKPQLATIDADQVEPGQYIYHFHPDWAAIIARLSDMPGASELIVWIEEQRRT